MPNKQLFRNQVDEMLCRIAWDRATNRINKAIKKKPSIADIPISKGYYDEGEEDE